MASQAGGGNKGTAKDLEETENLLKDFIYQRSQRNGDGNTTVTREQLGGGAPCDPIHKKLGKCLQKVGDELDGNVKYKSLINDPSLKPTKETFIRVATAVFSDGKFNWGRVVTLFCFAYHLVIKALENRVPDIIKTIIRWTMDYFQEHVIQWIRAQGGWEAVWSYFGTPTWQVVGVLLAGILTGFLVVRQSKAQ
ncbi:apoptosis regulator BAX-like [Centropristis striata]|uniref:apoptosis regulator BAX-like n=1 Tax=Centropristis striata TaxID=184440 RepID=UPI0027E19995|nr:apoptosis regulator BAX-like [Centropristis striata]